MRGGARKEYKPDEDQRQKRGDAVQEDEAKGAVAEAGIVRDDAVEPGEEGGEGMFAQEECKGDGGADEVGKGGG